MKAWGIKGPHGLIEVHGDLGRAMRSAVKHRIENGMDVKVVRVKVEEEMDKEPEESSSTFMVRECAEMNRDEVNSMITQLRDLIRSLDLKRSLANKLNSMNRRLKTVEDLAWEEAETIEYIKDENRRLDRKIQDVESKQSNKYQRLEVIVEQKLEELHNRLRVVEESIESIKDSREHLEEVKEE